MTHSMIRRFKIDGKIAGDRNLVRYRQMHEKILEDQMRTEGYVPLFDIAPAWSTAWDGKNYDFLLTMQGVYVGKDKAWDIEGISEGKQLSKPTPQAKLNQSSDR